LHYSEYYSNIIAPASTPTLAELDLSGNKIQDVGLQRVTVFLATKTNLPELKKLDISGNEVKQVLLDSFLMGLKFLRKGLEVAS
jgi:Leucine-rich repeat (LRR) protein